MKKPTLVRENLPPDPRNTLKEKKAGGLNGYQRNSVMEGTARFLFDETCT
ncbi:MAG: hypothetical protein HW380_3629 [Magnetococcales bacterium]|nr:hypothetical protein [Magnetococcales bacterium]